MKFKNGIVLVAITSVMAFSCKDNKEQPQTELQEEAVKEADRETYAELSVKTGGQWEGREYKGGTFENVQEITLPEDHTDHSYYIRYEGPGWENSQVGYRLYLDWRNAIDIFGKKVDSLVLPYVGQDNFDSYHEEAPWGQDILKAGNSLGIGGYGRYMNDTVAHFRNVQSTHAEVSNSANSSSVEITYEGWETGDKVIDLDAKLAIYPDGRYTRVELSPSEEIEGLTTGIVKFEDVPLMQKESEAGNWAYIATYGTQTLVNDEDKLGMAIFYKKNQLEQQLEGPDDHLLVFNSTSDKVTYYLLGAWEQEKGGIISEEAFISNLDELLNKLDSNDNLQ
ncbi:DUF4861 family protein [Autumnicola psychrophila]|uniref:DUF4861 family protein n=1 Tax=Autumnicola psychrophila TaxID=3075592 RepID=A0ABU3DV67_9FLAO|nr:DUF4861 family protein [Zunongwangia sp. F225]MDT0686982.1 DUF4861 family protein [Zunongwangia sp. F225]